MNSTKKYIQYSVWILAICAFIYFSAAWYFAGIIVQYDTKSITWEEQRYSQLTIPKQKASDGQLWEIAGKGILLKAWYFAPRQQSKCGIIFTHGHTASHYGMYKYGPVFQNRDCHLLFYDVRYHGQSGGHCGSYGFHERHDLLAILDFFEQQTGLVDKQVGLFGESMGAAISLQTAAYRPRLAFVIAESPFTSLQAMLLKRGQELYGPAIRFLLPGALLVADMRCDANLADAMPLRYAHRLQMPVLLIHSKSDELIPWQHSRSIFQAIPHNQKKLVTSDWGAVHARSIDTNYDRIRNEINSFLDLLKY
ncbi:MAG: alpha/beta fold hydrolase [Leptospiraceae bacterium]|nr:alpha/beta fold hydrolase [Leptospiraceae bacterium]